MTELEKEYFMRIIILLLVYGKEALIDCLEYHLKNKKLDFEQFINLYQHEIYHLCFTTCCKKGCIVSSRFPFVHKRILNPVQLGILFDNTSTRQPYHKSSFNGDYCCCLAKSGIQTDVLDITLANCLLINFCKDVFWNCCSKPGKDLTPFLNRYKHEIFHLANSSQICCMCDSTSCPYITQETIPSYMWQSLFNIPSSNTCKNTINQHICCMSPSAGQTPEHLNDEYTHVLHKQFCLARKSVHILVNYRNIYVHADKTHVPVAEYRKIQTNIVKAIMILPKLPGKKEQTREKLKNFEKLSLDLSQSDQIRSKLQELINRDRDLEGVVLTFTNDIKEEIRSKHRDQDIKLDHVKVEIKEEIYNRDRKQDVKLDDVKNEIKEEMSHRHREQDYKLDSLKDEINKKFIEQQIEQDIKLDRVESGMKEFTKINREQDSKCDQVNEKLLRAEASRNFYHIYMFAASLFIQMPVLKLSVNDQNHLCDGGSKFKIKPASYPSSTVFMSILTEGWIRFSETVEKYTEFCFKRVKNSNGGKQFYYIISVDYPKYYLIMGFCGWWMRAKFYDDQPNDDDALWDIRCLKTKEDSLYLLVPKNSEEFACVDCTRRLKGSCGVLDVSKMFLFEKV